MNEYSFSPRAPSTIHPPTSSTSSAQQHHFHFHCHCHRHCYIVAQTLYHSRPHPLPQQVLSISFSAPTGWIDSQFSRTISFSHSYSFSIFIISTKISLSPLYYVFPHVHIERRIFSYTANEKKYIKL